MSPSFWPNRCGCFRFLGKWQICHRWVQCPPSTNNLPSDPDHVKVIETLKPGQGRWELTEAATKWRAL
jgi:hypothetical protein